MNKNNFNLPGLLRAPKFENPAKDRIAILQYNILIGMFITGILGAGVSLASWSTNSIVGFGILVFELLLSAFAFYLQRQGYLELTSWILVGTIYAVFILGLSVSGFTFPIALVLTLVISLAGLLFRYYSVIAITVFTIITIWVLPYIIAMPVEIKLNELGYVSVILILEGLLLTVASRTLENSFSEADRSTRDLLHANNDLQDLAKNLEQRVADRTRDLATVAEVGTATATILETSNLLQAMVDLTKERFNLYHSHIYLLDDEGKNLVLTVGAGEPGRIMVAEKRSIPLSREQSLVARAARERKGVTVNDVTQDPDFLPNPLLPNTRSELAVPMTVGGNVIGVFDVQSDEVGRFTDADINIQTTLAAQIAVSLQNVRSFERSKSQADLESLVNTIGQKIQRATTVEDTLQTAIREIGLALSASRVTGHITTKQPVDNKS